MEAVERIDKFLEECGKAIPFGKKEIPGRKKKKKLSEQLKSGDFDLVAGFISQEDEFGVDAAISRIRDKVKEEMDLIMKIVPTSELKKVKMIFKKFFGPFDKAMTALEGDPLNKAKYKKAEKAFENLVKGTKDLV